MFQRIIQYSSIQLLDVCVWYMCALFCIDVGMHHVHKEVWRNRPRLLFCLIHEGRVSQSKQELTDNDSLFSLFPLGEPVFTFQGWDYRWVTMMTYNLHEFLRIQSPVFMTVWTMKPALQPGNIQICINNTPSDQKRFNSIIMPRDRYHDTVSVSTENKLFLDVQNLACQLS